MPWLWNFEGFHQDEGTSLVFQDFKSITHSLHFILYYITCLHLWKIWTNRECKRKKSTIIAMLTLKDVSVYFWTIGTN